MRLSWWRPWWRDLSDYFGVDPIKALALGTRAKGRRPWGWTLEEMWAMKPRQTEAEVQAFYRDVGSWFTYRQVVRHRRTRFPAILRALRRIPLPSLLEYGCGVAPVAWWLAGHRLDGLHVALLDVDSEHFDFGCWRLGRRLTERGRIWSVDPRIIKPGELPLREDERFDIITILEVFEHLPNPLAVAEHLVGHLAPSGRLFEDFFVHADADGSGPDLPQAQAERPDVYNLLSARLQLVAGHSQDDPDGGGTREWRNG